MLIRSLAEFETQGRVIAISHGKSAAVRLLTRSDGVGLAVRPGSGRTRCRRHVLVSFGSCEKWIWRILQAVA